MSARGFCVDLGPVDYGEIFLLQEKLNKARSQGKINDLVLLLEHQPCFTIGRKGGFEHILVNDRVLEKEGIRLYETDRGGDITYHGPGQLICYPIIDLGGYGRDVHDYARRLEKVLIKTLESYGIRAGRKAEYPGVWVGQSKIAAMGIGVRRWITMHGVSLNVCPDMNHFSLIVPCGLTGFGVTSMTEQLGEPVDIAEVRQQLRLQFSREFDLELADISLQELKGIADEHTPA